MKATLTFTLPEDADDHIKAVKAPDAFLALWRIQQEIFRPARKHGYNDAQLNKLLEIEAVGEAIGLLEGMYREIIDDLGLNDGLIA